ncbi:MAG: hypothetical protein JOZ07_11325 [Solirubrobacterales bacterium]|nr:hypothetical protein [Solirubrobacterales bacterium]
MKSTPLLFAALVAAVAPAATPASASAKIVELGQTSTPLAAPACPKGVAPSQCFIILTRTTAVQATSDGVVNPTRVRQAGWIVAFSVGLSNLSSQPKTEHSYLHTLDQAYGGTPQMMLTVLRPGPSNTYTVAAQSGTYHLIPFLGGVLQQPLSLPPKFSAMTALRVDPGDVVGITVPTWAPVLTYNLSASKFVYRQSRAANCKNAAAGNTAQTKVGASARYLCSYTGTRVEYTATEIVNTPYPAKYVHARAGG